MELKELLTYDNITIQCHDNPDADAIASGYALLCYLREHDKKAILIYSGASRVTKDNLTIMLDKLSIPLQYRRDNTKKISGLLVTVDCQYGANNVTKFEADDYAIIDHHQKVIYDVEKSHIISDLGSCSTVVWQMLKQEDFPFSKYPNLQTALYYGLYTDTSQFADMMNPVDRDMMDALAIDKSTIHLLQNSNINARELEIAGVAMIRATVNKELRFAIVKAEPCDPNILGLISDMVLQVSEIDACVVFCLMTHGIKFSVRSCVKESRADHIAQFISEGIGSGGGHTNKAGGFISAERFAEHYAEYDETAFFAHQMKRYMKAYEVVNVKDYVYEIEDVKKYVKKQLRVGYVKTTDIVAPGTNVVVRTLEGDINVTTREDLYLMIGVKGEIYPIDADKFEKSYVIGEDEQYDMVLQYHPKAKILATGVDYSLLDYAKVCYSNGGNEIYAKRLNNGVKVFTKWDSERYMLGNVGDVLAARADDLHDIYVIEGETFEMTYDLVEE